MLRLIRDCNDSGVNGAVAGQKASSCDILHKPDERILWLDDWPWAIRTEVEGYLRLGRDRGGEPRSEWSRGQKKAALTSDLSKD